VSFDARPVRHAYEDIADEYASKFAGEIATNEFDRSVIDDAVAKLGPAAVVIDLGCGPGQVACYLSARGWWPVGIDLTPAMLAIARERNEALPLVCGDLLGLPLRGAAADCIVAWYSLHNLPRTVLPEALSEIRRVLRPGGVLLIGTHGGRGEDVVEQAWKGQTETVVITYYEPDELADLFARYGFRVSSVRQRPPLDHEHQVTKLYVSADAN
jgi:ubiquinone/menaquinone biosynthesis C-methylase UbiE